MSVDGHICLADDHPDKMNRTSEPARRGSVLIAFYEGGSECVEVVQRNSLYHKKCYYRGSWRPRPSSAENAGRAPKRTWKLLRVFL